MTDLSKVRMRSPRRQLSMAREAKVSNWNATQKTATACIYQQRLGYKPIFLSINSTLIQAFQDTGWDKRCEFANW